MTPPTQHPTAAAVMIGDELLSGKVSDSNSHHLVSSLRDLGCALRRIATVPDDLDLIGQEVIACAQTHDFVITSGGIGPTHDDITMEALALAFDCPLIRHEALVQDIERVLGPDAPEPLFSMADIPERAELIRDSTDQLITIVRIENIYCLPGEPTFFRNVFDSIRERFRGIPFHHHRIYSLLDEGELADMLREIQARHTQVAIGSYPRPKDCDHRVMVSIDSSTEDAARRAFEELLHRLPPESVVRSL
ncbi:MAG: molybdopterin-binding protein [Planctomycetota bacterium]|nr:molybdopterin-binding protein [Planctomycetota bacterium]